MSAAAKNSIILHGDDSYGVVKARQKIVAKFKEKNKNSADINYFEAVELEPRALRTFCASAPLFSPKRLVIIKDAFSHGDEGLLKEIDRTAQNLPSETLLVLEEKEEIKPKNKLLKALFKRANVKLFPPPSPAKLNLFIKRHLRRRGGSIEDAAARELISRTGPDLWLLENELNKLLAHRKTITFQSVSELTYASTPTIVFDLLEKVLRRQRRSSLLSADDLRSQGEQPIALFALLAGAFRNILMVKLALQDSMPYSALASKLKMHPFVVKKTVPLANRTALPKIVKIYQLFLHLDVAVKSGKIDSDTALDVAIAKLTK